MFNFVEVINQNSNYTVNYSVTYSVTHSDLFFDFENLIFIGNQLNGKFLSIYSLFSILFRI